MSIYKLTLIPERGSSIKVDLSTDQILRSSLNDPAIAQKYVYSDHSYCAGSRGVEEIREDISFFVNDMEIDIKRIGESSEKIVFSDEKYPGGRIFSHNFGLIQIAIQIVYEGRLPIMLFSNYISVLVVNNRTNLSVERMARYIYYNQESLLLSGQLLSEQQRSLKGDAQKELESQIQILRDIIQVYSENIGYFRLNARFHLSSMGYVDNYEKVRFVSNRTLSYIVQHPEYLSKTSLPTGIRVNGQNYLPDKTLVEENTINYDIYENQIIVGFLKSLYHMVDTLMVKIYNRIIQYPDKKEVEKGYFLSTAFVFATTKRRLEKIKEQLTFLRRNIEELYVQYHNILPVSEQNIFQVPIPSTILISVRPYRLIYDQIVRWFQFGIYDFSREDFILPMLQSNKLYEYYVLLKLFEYIQTKGYQIQSKDLYKYKYQNSALFNTVNLGKIKSNNTFVFWRDDTSIELTLYYEPVIYSGISKNVGENALSLFRNISFSYKKGETGKNYCPDYVLKIKKESCSYYIILDAKFSSQRSVKEYYIRELLYKYILSISTIDQQDALLGLIVVNGKSNELEDSDLPINIYDQVSDGQTVHPFAKMITLTENQEDQDRNAQLHIKLMDNLFASIIS